MAHRQKDVPSFGETSPENTAVALSKMSPRCPKSSVSDGDVACHSSTTTELPSSEKGEKDHQGLKNDLTLQMIGSLMSRGMTSSNSMVLLYYAMQDQGLEREGKLLLEGFRNNRKKAIQEFMG